MEAQNAIKKAFEMGKEAHSGQTRQSGDAYFTHPVSVAQMLAQMGGDRDTIIAALLHDTVEDTSLTLSDIEREFGPMVAVMIDGATKLGGDDVAERPTLDEKIETLRKMFTLMEKDVRIMVIKLIDRLHNMQTISFRKPEKQKAVAKETLDIYVKIADRLCMRDLRDELEQLCYEVLEPEKTALLLEVRRKNSDLAQEKIKEIEHTIMEKYPDTDLEAEFEKKSFGRLRIQLEIEQESGDKQPEVNIVFKCKDVDCCYRMLGIVHQLWPREAMTFDDFINLPVINGYKGLHTTVIMNDGTRIRCKIRTHEMDKYAHAGITTQCFDSEVHGLLDYLPWVKRISPLASDTKDKSSEFWETLQSDILGESIIVYGPANQSILVPSTATVLDAALYLFPEKAFHLTAIRMNGRQVPLSQQIEHASRIEIATGEKETVHRDWLYWVQTGLGIAIIREKLSKSSDGNLQEIGKSILQQALTERGAGYVEEFDADLIKQSVYTLGYNSLDDAYVAIAHRHLEPSEVIGAFEQARNRNKKIPLGEKREDCSFMFTVDRDVSSLRKLLNVYDRYNIKMRDIRLRLSRSQTLRMKVKVHMSQSEQEAYRQELIAAGAENVTMTQSTKKEILLMIVVVLMWGLNPVWARYLIDQGITPVTLVSIRSIAFFVFSALLFAVWRYVRGRGYSPIPRATWLALSPALATFVLSLLTYLSISQLSPSTHLTILRFNALLLPIIPLGMMRKKATRSSLVMLGIVAAGMIGFFMLPGISNLGVLFALLSLTCYMCYSLVTERVLNEYKIGARYPYFLFHIGIILGILGLLLLPSMIPTVDQWSGHLGNIVLYAFLCVFIPHTCFHIVLQNVQFRHVTSISLFEVPLAVALEILLLGLILHPFSYGLIGLVLLAIAALRLRRIIR
jgi:GTP pyrophosphokinase